MRILPEMVSKIGLLDAATVRKVIAAYTVAEGYEKAMRRYEEGEDEREEVVPIVSSANYDVALQVTEFAVHILDTAIVALGGRPQDQEWWSPPKSWLHSTGSG